MYQSQNIIYNNNFQMQYLVKPIKEWEKVNIY